ncbi:hypothetical protein BOX15_Mlig015315g1 [Macrostomum lignano]|uniref:ANK_REP_REGION domain-containing protein n=1 Tax=Macrostomum lignano TaxID=282301 RepID=A0A267H024_9PLAT|nr:hypothetical protein BOX15_Mlig015315g1 [Macrostomum lignano]
MAEPANIKDAVAIGDLQSVEAFLQAISDGAERGKTAHKLTRLAARSRQWEIVRLLVQAVEDSSLKDECCLEVAKVAALSNEWAMLKFLVEAIADQSVKDLCCQKTVKSAARSSQWETIKFLVQTAADPKVKNSCCLKAMNLAVSERHWNLFLFLLQETSDQDLKNSYCSEVCELAASESQWEVVKLLLQAASDPAVTDRCCSESACFAAAFALFDTVQFLSERITDRSAKDQCCSKVAVIYAEAGRLDLTKDLVHCIADQKVKDECCKETAKSAASESQTPELQFLLESISDQSTKNQCCIEATQEAIKGFSSNTESLRLGGDQTDLIRDNEGDDKEVKHQVSALQMLFESLSDGQVKDQWCLKAAESAAAVGRLEVVQFAVQRASERSVQEQCWARAAESAARSNQFGLVKCMLPGVVRQDVKDECCMQSVKYHASTGCIKEAKYFFFKLSSKSLRNKCSEEVLTDISTSEHKKLIAQNSYWTFVDFLVQAISDQDLKDRCCSELIRASSKIHWPAWSFLINLILDQTVKDDCCRVLAQSASQQGQIDIAKNFMKRVAAQSIKDKCCLEIVTSATPSTRNWQFLTFLLASVVDIDAQNECCIAAAAALMEKYGWSKVKFFLRRIIGQGLRDLCFAAMSYNKKFFSDVLQSNPRMSTEAINFAMNIVNKSMRSKFLLDLASHFTKPKMWDEVNKVLNIIIDQKLNDQNCRKSANTAVSARELDIVKQFLQTKTELGNKISAGEAIVQTAAEDNHFDTINLLLQAIPDPFDKDQCCLQAILRCFVPLKVACVNDDFLCIIFDSASSSQAQDQFRMLVAIISAQSGDLESLKSYLSSIADAAMRRNCCRDAAVAAARCGESEVLEFLLSTVADPNDKDEICFLAAKSAASHSRLKCFQLLVQTVADQKQRSQCCMRSEVFANDENKLSSVKRLVQAAGANGFKDQFCMEVASAINYFSGPEPPKELQYLIDAVSSHQVRDFYCIEAAKRAASGRNWKLVKCLLQTIADSAIAKDFCLQVGETAAKDGHVEILKEILDRETSANKKLLSRRKCAMAACSRLHEHIVAYLGLEPDWLFQYSTILSFTAAMAIEGRNSVLNDTLSRMQPAQITQLLCLSISQRHVALAVTLIKDERVSTQHVDLPDSTGATALMLAADAGHHELIENLIDLGASVRAEDSQGRTALSRACEAGHVRAAKALMDRGADASHRDGRSLTCGQLAEQFGHSQQLMQLISGQSEKPKCQKFFNIMIAIDDEEHDWQLSEKLHALLKAAGFTQERAQCQQSLASVLESTAQVLAQDNGRMHMTGSYAEGWANSLEQVNGRTAADSDIDWTVLADGQALHLEGFCMRQSDGCKTAPVLPVSEGHAVVATGSGSQPAKSSPACGVRPAQDLCHAIRCCNGSTNARLGSGFPLNMGNEAPLHLVRATRPNSANELRVSFSLQEKDTMRQLSTVQGQLFTLIKFIFKRHLPLTLDTPGLKTYHAKTLLFAMLEKHGANSETEAWQPHNLIALLKESLDMMLSFIDSSSSPDECMPHFFMPDAPLYFKNAGIGGDFDNTKARVRDRLCELRSDIGGVVEQLRRLVRPLQSEKFYFHPFTLLPLTAPPAVTGIKKQPEYLHFVKFADVYSVVHQCVSELQSESSDRDTLMRQLSLLHELQWCKCAALCMTAMAHLKFGESEEAQRLAMELQRHQVESGLKPENIEVSPYDPAKLPEDSDWAWRFCLPCDSSPRFPFLPEFTQTLFTARLSQPLSSHLYVNFRCLSWSLQADLLRNRAPVIQLEDWKRELEEDPDLEELLTLAHYSDCREHVELSLQQMEMIEKERRVAMETQDEEKIGWVKEKLKRLDALQ